MGHNGIAILGYFGYAYIMSKIFSIGYGGLNTESFIRLLKMHAIEMLVDVRSQPYSKYNPDFIKKNLERIIRAEAIQYLYLGDKLGGKREDKSFTQIEQESDYKDAIKKVADETKSKNVCLMCAESEPERCHRAHLNSQTLWKMGHDVGHILHNGRIVQHAELRRILQSNQHNLF